tara:strand:- start:1439 stop:1825 length:387 start_codon:yes stop_codon:yes gene_type:complete
MNNKIIDLVGKRLIKGEEKYGNENVTSDGRDFIQEALEESLDLAVYVAAKLIEIKQKENNIMGARIDMENRQDSFEHRLKLIEDAVEELSRELVNAPKIHHVDLTDTHVEPTTKRKLKKTKKTETISA